MNQTKIGWTDFSWNPVHGCSKVSAGCDNCYAETVSHKFGLTTLPWTGEHAEKNVMLKPHKLREPYRLKEPSRVFVNSMSDLFHPQAPESYVDKVFAVMRDCPQHTFQILTKRPRRAASYPSEWTPNIWMGVSVESRATLHRISTLRRCNAKLRFLSIEPLLEPLDELDLSGIGWVIVGGESGKGFRPMQHDWVHPIRDQCVESNIPFFFKQSAAFKNETGTELIESDGSKTVYHQFP